MTNKTKAQKNVADWIDTSVIAEVMSWALKENGMRATELRLREVWLLMVEGLYDVADAVAYHIKTKRGMKQK